MTNEIDVNGEPEMTYGQKLHEIRLQWYLDRAKLGLSVADKNLQERTEAVLASRA